jgi:hypothetical protein
VVYVQDPIVTYIFEGCPDPHGPVTSANQYTASCLTLIIIVNSVLWSSESMLMDPYKYSIRTILAF